MDSTARRCVIWAIVCMVTGTLFTIWLPDMLTWLASEPLRNSNAIYFLTEITLAGVRWTAFPIGGALIASAIIISWLRKHSPARAASIAHDQEG